MGSSYFDNSAQAFGVESPLENTSTNNSQKHNIRQPRNVVETGIPGELITDLILKHLYDGVTVDLPNLRDRTKLAGNLLEGLLEDLRRNQRIQALSPANGEGSVRYQLTELGRVDASSALMKSGYIGPAPISIEHYTSLINAQSVLRNPITQEKLLNYFEEIVIDPALLSTLGPALCSGRAILVYGAAGTGKTYICKHLAGLLDGTIYIPYSIAVGHEIIQYFDPLIHQPVVEREVSGVQGYDAITDPRLIQCTRPVAISGGELTMANLEIKHDFRTHNNFAPVQLKANNGIYIIDDLGRQRMEPAELFNRWIVPMDERHDYLVSSTGKQLQVPFDCVLIFSTNLKPHDLADQAFLRRLGYKIQFTPINEIEFKTIWNNLAIEKKVQFDPEVLDWVLDQFRATGRDLLPCHPRDLMGSANDLEIYLDNNGVIKLRHIEMAWNTYFIEA